LTARGARVSPHARASSAAAISSWRQFTSSSPGGQPFTPGLNGGPQFQFNEAISFQIPVETPAEADRFANALSAAPEAEQCGWVKDRFGVSWQIVPRQLVRLIGDADRTRARRAFEAMMQMKRIDIAALERAADGITPPA
jgi:predicted 3-demethylubiquinone-9 3-methyltransferase (glyoxalase superfamily)